MKTVFWDIEAGGLKAPFDQVFCSAFKPYGEKPYIIQRSASDSSDAELCLAIVDELAKYDIVVTYYGLGYDKPFVSSRLLKHGYRPLPRQLHIDCYRLAKKIFVHALHSRRLISICELLGIGEKNRVEPDIWEKIKYTRSEKDVKKLLADVVDHCRKDVISLEKRIQ